MQRFIVVLMAFIVVFCSCFTNTNILKADAIRSGFDVIEFEDFDSQTGIQVDSGAVSASGGKCVGWIDQGDTLLYKAVDFGSGAEGIKVKMSSYVGQLVNSIEFKLDSVDNPSFTKVVVAWSPKGIYDFEDSFAAMAKITGIHDVYVVCNLYGYNLDFFQLTEKSVNYRPDSDENRSAFYKIEAEDYQDFNQASLYACEEDGTKDFGDIKDGTFIKYSKLDFGDIGAKGILLRAGAMGDGGKTEVWIDGLRISGKKVADVQIPATGYWQKKVDVTVPLLEVVTGVHDVYIYSYTTFNLNWLKFLVEVPDINYNEKVPFLKYKDTQYIPVDNTKTRDLYSDTWVATDDQNRVMPTFKDVGGPKNKTTGMFYFLWHEWTAIDLYVVPEILKQPKELQQWGPYGLPHFNGTPYLGYYMSHDPYVIRKHLQLLADSQVDTLIIDMSNGSVYPKSLEILCETGYQMLKEGVKVPKFVAFMGGYEGIAKIELPILWDYIYKEGHFRDLWFMWKGKPLALGIPSKGMDQEMVDSFEWRKCWAFYTSPELAATEGKDHWSWVDLTNNYYSWHEDPNIPEEISVSVASHPINNVGRSQSKGIEYYDVDQERIKKGLHFEEQWERALRINPEFTMVTGWNEWYAGRFPITGPPFAGWNLMGKIVQPGDNFFVDSYNEEFSRDIEPDSGFYGDSYYYQNIYYTRKYKGVRPIPQPSGEKTITMNKDFSQWDNVKPEFRDSINDINERNYISFAEKYTYTNDTGRNDIRNAKIARDDKNIYFYVDATNNISAPEGENWMSLMLNIDGNSKNGWEGYDYIINRKNPENNMAIVEKFVDGWKFETIGTVELVYDGNKMQLSVPRELLNISDLTKPLTIDFKWGDNFTDTGDILKFIDIGDVAPNGRFNFRFTENIGNIVSNELENVLKDNILLTIDNNTAVVNNILQTIDKTDERIKPFIKNDKAMIPLRFISENLGADVEYENGNIVITKANKRIVLQNGSDNVSINDVDFKIDAKVEMFNDRLFVPLKSLTQILDKKMLWCNGSIIISDNEIILDEKLKEEINMHFIKRGEKQ